MHDAPPINRTLLTLLDNQAARTRAALEDLPETVFTAEPGGDCKSIREIGRHLVVLRRFQLGLLGSPRAANIADPGSITTQRDLLAALGDAESELRAALAEHDPDDWYALPETPREGKWGDEPTLLRLARPFNDFVNHLGSIRAIRRILGHPIDRTQ